MFLKSFLLFKVDALGSNSNKSRSLMLNQEYTISARNRGWNLLKMESKLRFDFVLEI